MLLDLGVFVYDDEEESFHSEFQGVEVDANGLLLLLLLFNDPVDCACGLLYMLFVLLLLFKFDVEKDG